MNFINSQTCGDSNLLFQGYCTSSLTSDITIILEDFGKDAFILWSYPSMLYTTLLVSLYCLLLCPLAHPDNTHLTDTLTYSLVHFFTILRFSSISYLTGNVHHNDFLG